MAEDFSQAISSIDEIIEDARNGRMYILVDAEDRENEGDLIIPATFATPDQVNFMAKYGRGLICLAMTNERARALNLDMMARDNRESMQTAFTVSIEAKEGVTTGISAADRAKTVAVAIDPTLDHNDIVSPGHVFPAGGARWRHAGARGPYRSGRRHLPHGRALSGGRHLRDHE